jgi:hypothetical protein
MNIPPGIDPEFASELAEKLERLNTDADAWHAEVKVRLAGAGARLQIDADFLYKVMLLTAIMVRTQPGVPRRILIKMAAMNVIVLELAQEHLDGQVGS